MNDPSNESGARLAGFALKNSVPMNLSFIVLVLASGTAIWKMPVDVYPDIALGEATVDTIWLGASAEDVERLITDRIEDEIQDLRSIQRIVSDSKPDASLIRVKFKENLSESGLDAALRELRAAVDRVVDLPDDAEKPLVSKISVSEVFYLLWVAVEDVGGVGEAVLHDVAFRLKPVLREVPGVAKVDDKLIRDREVHIKVNDKELRKYGLTMLDLAEILRQYNVNLPSGTMEQPDSEIAIRAEGSVTAPEQLGSIVISKNPAGGHVYLRDVAAIETGFARKTFFARCNLHDCLALGVAKTDEADSRVVAKEVRQVLRDFEAGLPAGVALSAFDDTSEIISSRLQVLITNMAGGAVLVFLVLWVAVGLRNSILAIIGIPFSFGCALICMHLLGVTINAVSLVGLVLCTGMIVDDAIVVLENIYRHIQEAGVTRADRSGLMRAISLGAGEVCWPVVSSSATTVAAFLPLLIMEGHIGDFFAIIPKTVTVVLAASLFECLLVLPVHYLDFGFRVRASATGQPERARSGLRERLAGSGKRAYERLLAAVLSHRYLAPLPLLALGFVTYCVLPLVDVELYPSEFQQILVDVHTADEASLDQTGEIVRPIEALALSLEDVCSGVLTSFGLMMTDENTIKLRSNLAQLHVQLARTTALGADTVAAANVLRTAIEDYLAANPDCGVVAFRVIAPRTGPPVGKPVSIRIESPDFKTAKLLAEQYKTRLNAIDGVYGINDNLEFGQQQINFVIDEDRASVHALTFLTLASALRIANDGLVVSTFKDTRSGEDLDVRLMLDPKHRRRVEDLLDLDVRTPRGYVVKAGQIADLEVKQGYAGIPHYRGKRSVTVTAEIDTTQTTAHEVNRLIKREFESRLRALPNVRVVYGGQFAETQQSFRSLGEAYIIALAVIYFLLATQFRSYGQPLVIICTVPFAGIGVVAGLLFSDYSFTIMTFIAIVGMSGVVVNDSILLVDCANQKRRTGLDALDALRAACLQRLRPILMTTITTVLGLAPLALGLGGRSSIWSPFAASFVWGLTFSTIITLLIVPAAYAIAHDVTARYAARRTSADVVGDRR
jgi:HAE1 family hydrophobic/amphiphilic exporter-1